MVGLLSARGLKGFHGGLGSACNVGDLGLIPGLGPSPGGGHGNPLQYSCLENPRVQRSLVGYSPWGCKELDMTELSTKHRGLKRKGGSLNIGHRSLDISKGPLWSTPKSD